MSSPARVATLGWSDQDFALALGVAPVGAVKITWGGNEKASTPWYDAKLAELDAHEPTRYDDADGAPVEEIAKLTPDLILATNSGLTQDEYTKLSKIAPVVAFPGEAWGTPWQTSLDLVGRALGKEREATQVRKETEASIAAAAATGSSSLINCSSVSSTSRGRVLRMTLPRRTRSSRGMSSITGSTCLRKGPERMLSRYSDAPDRPRASP